MDAVNRELAARAGQHSRNIPRGTLARGPVQAIRLPKRSESSTRTPPTDSQVQVESVHIETILLSTRGLYFVLRAVWDGSLLFAKRRTHQEILRKIAKNHHREFVLDRNQRARTVLNQRAVRGCLPHTGKDTPTQDRSRCSDAFLPSSGVSEPRSCPPPS